MLLQVLPVPAMYKELENSYSLAKNGYVTFEFVPIIVQQESKGEIQQSELRRANLDLNIRKAMIITMKNIRDIIDLDTSNQSKD